MGKPANRYDLGHPMGKTQTLFAAARILLGRSQERWANSNTSVVQQALNQFEYGIVIADRDTGRLIANEVAEDMFALGRLSASASPWGLDRTSSTETVAASDPARITAATVRCANQVSGGGGQSDSREQTPGAWHVGDVTADGAETAVERGNSGIDGLAGLATRQTLDDALSYNAMSDTRALFIIEIDNFRDAANPTGKGHGDHVENAVADRIKTFFGDNLTARLREGKFAALIASRYDLQSLKKIAAELQNFLNFDNQFNDSENKFTYSIGFAFNKNGKLLPFHAESALYHAQHAGGDTVAWFPPLSR